MDLVSIIVPVYNVQSYLAMCLESIAGQTYNNLQIILVDDGSMDACPYICDEWAEKDERIKVIHKENGGLSDARNTGLAYATGQYICFVDSDDVLDTHYIEWLHEAIVVNKVKMAACDVHCFYDEDMIDVSGDKNNYVVYSSEEALCQILHGEGIRAIACNKLYSATLLANEKFVYGKHHEDEFFTYRIVDKAEKVVYIDVELYYYRQHPGSIMASFSIKRLDALEAFLERLDFLCKKYPNLYRRDKIAFCVSCIFYYRLALENKNADMRAIREKIVKLRKQVHFTPVEMFSYSVREIIYILGSRCLKPFCTMLNLLRGRSNE